MQAPFADPFIGLKPLSKILPLVGREIEMQTICTLLDTVALDSPVGARALTIIGDIGVGKSRLLAEIYVEARSRSFRIIEGRTYTLGSMFPYFPFIEALRPILHSTPIEQLRHYVGLDGANLEAGQHIVADSLSLAGAALVTALAHLFPELPKRLHIPLTQEILSPDQEKFRLFDAIATLLERIALDDPVLLAIDNLQWADGASLELTMYLTVRLHNSRVALVGATRPPDTSNQQEHPILPMTVSYAAARALGELMRQGLLLLLPLGPLSEDEAAHYLQALLPGALSQNLALSLLTRAEGNPFYLEELVRMLTLNGKLLLRDGAWRVTGAISTTLPDTITLAVQQRLQGLSATCRELLRVAALFGRTFPQQALALATGKSNESVQFLLAEAAQSELIAKAHALLWDEDAASVANVEIFPPDSPAPAMYIFCQGIVQEVLSAEVPPHEGRLLHGAIGAALEAEFSISGRDISTAAQHADLARHYVLSDEQEAALRWSFLAGEDAARQQAHREAINHFRVVLRLLEAGVQSPIVQEGPGIARIHLSIGESWFKLGELELAAHAFQQAVEQCQSEKKTLLQTSSFLLAKANRLIADVYRMQGKYELALAHLHAARSAIDTETYAVVEPQVSMLPGTSKGHPYVQQAMEPPTFLNAYERVLLLQAQATLDLLFNRAREAEAALWQSHQLATEIGDRSSQAFVLHMVGWIRGWGEHIYEAIRLQKQAHELYVAIGDPFRAVLGDQGLGIIYQTLGEMEQARLHNLRGFEQARRYGVRYVLGWLHWNQGVMAFVQGDWANSEYHLECALQEAEANSNVRLKPVVLEAQAVLQFRRGNWYEAEPLFQAAILAGINTEWYVSTLALYGHFLALTGRRIAAKAQLDLAVAEPEPIGYSGHFYIPFFAEAYLRLGENERALDYFERIRFLRGFMYYGVSVDRILGEVAAVQGNWEMAEQAFENGLALCRHAGNQPEEAAILYEQARSILIQSGTDTRHFPQSFQRMQSLCESSRALFLHYGMQRAVDLVDTLLEGARQLEAHANGEIVEQIIHEHISHPDYQLDLHLTKRELEVLRLVAKGHTDREVADVLVISHRTVNRHLSNIFVKLDVPGRAAAVAFAIRQGLVE